MRNIKIKENLIFLIISILFVVLFSYTTVWKMDCMDQDIFMTSGWLWSNGKIPYIDFFDHKGPFIFFVNMLGFKITGSIIGVVILQIIFMLFTVKYLYRIIQLECNNDQLYIPILLVVLLFLTITYQSGNLTEEWCLPFIVSSMYYTLKYFNDYSKDKSAEHNKWYAFIYGISFAICLLTRVTNALSICIGIFIIFILLTINKKFKNIFENIIYFILGFLVTTLPFVIYFCYNHAFMDFVNGTLLYNIKYASNETGSWLSQGFSIENVKKYIKYYSIAYILILPLVINFKKISKEKRYFYILLILFEQYLLLKCRSFTHYAMICIPNAAIVLCEMLKNKSKYKILNILSYILLIVIIGITFKISVGESQYAYNQITKNDEIKYYNKLINSIPKKERNSFIAYNIEKNIYISNNIEPYYKYFMYQDWQASNSKEMKKDLYKIYNNGDVKYILFEGNIDKSVITPILRNRYEIIKKIDDKNLYLFKIKK